MSNENILYMDCDACVDGVIKKLVIDPITNLHTWSDTQCTKCAGTGTRRGGSLSPELIIFLQDMNDKVNDIMDKCNDIFEKVNE